jgi:hypothetical protein
MLDTRRHSRCCQACGRCARRPGLPHRERSEAASGAGRAALSIVPNRCEPPVSMPVGHRELRSRSARTHGTPQEPFFVAVNRATLTAPPANGGWAGRQSPEVVPNTAASGLSRGRGSMSSTRRAAGRRPTMAPPSRSRSSAEASCQTRAGTRRPPPDSRCQQMAPASADVDDGRPRISRGAASVGAEGTAHLAIVGNQLERKAR